jgi:hypothetical protein
MNITHLIAKTSIVASMIITGVLGLSSPSQSRNYIINNNDAKMQGKVAEIRGKFDNFLIVFKGCKRSGSAVRCSYTIRNKGGGYGVIMMNPLFGAKLIEPSGKMTRGTLSVAGGSDSGFPVTLSIEQGIDYLAVVTFDSVSEDATVIQQLSLPFNNLKNLGYVNVPIE